MGSLQNPLIQLSASAMMFIPLLSACGGDSGDSGSKSSSLHSVSISGKLAQAYVENATVIADRIEPGSLTGNCQKDSDEEETRSDENGAFTLSVNYDDYVICTKGGRFRKNDGTWEDAAPMMTPAPTSSSSEWNITPLTTLVTTQPELKNELDKIGGWNTDIASEKGASSELIRLAKTVETYWKASKDLISETSKELESIKHLANQINKIRKTSGLNVDNDTLQSITSKALENTFNDTKIISETNKVGMVKSINEKLQKTLAKGVFKVPTSGIIIEKEYQKVFDNATESLNSEIDNLMNGPPEIRTLFPIQNTQNNNPTYYFNISHPGKVSVSGKCSNQPKEFQSGDNHLVLNYLAPGKYNDCKIKITRLSDGLESEINIPEFVIQEKIENIPPVISNLIIKEQSESTSPTLRFHSTKSGNIKITGNGIKLEGETDNSLQYDCKSSISNARKGDNIDNFWFSNLTPGIYDNCSISITDDFGNVSDEYKVPTFIVARKIISSGFGIQFDPQIKSIKCEIIHDHKVQFTANISDDGDSLSHLLYSWNLDGIESSRIRAITTCDSDYNKLVEDESIGPNKAPQAFKFLLGYSNINECVSKRTLYYSEKSNDSTYFVHINNQTNEKCYDGVSTKKWNSKCVDGNIELVLSEKDKNDNETIVGNFEIKIDSWSVIIPSGIICDY